MDSLPTTGSPPLPPGVSSSTDPRRRLVQERIIFEDVVVAMLRAMGPALTPQVEAKLAAVGWKKKFPAYPLTTWRDFLRICREAAFPHVPEREGYRRLGMRFVDGYSTTLLGAALAKMVGLLGPERSLRRVTQSFRSANNFTETAVSVLADGSHALWMNGVDDADFTVGILQRGLELTGAKGIDITYRFAADETITFTIRWQ